MGMLLSNCAFNGGLIALGILASILPPPLDKSFPIPTPNSQPRDITLGADGNMWFTESELDVSQIGRIDAQGIITEFIVPTQFSQPSDIASGTGRRTVVYGTFRLSRFLHREGDDQWPVYGIPSRLRSSVRLQHSADWNCEWAGRKSLVPGKHTKRSREAYAVRCLYVLYHSNPRRRTIGHHCRPGWCALVWGVSGQQNWADRC